MTPVERLGQINGAGDGGESFAVGLGAVVDWEEPRFIDRAKQARGWSDVAVENLDSEGALASLPDGVSSTKFFFSSSSDSTGILDLPQSRGGRFRVTWTGAATVASTLGCTNVATIDSNTVELDCDWNGNKWIVFTPMGFPVKVSIIKTSLLSLHAEGEVYDPGYLGFLPSGGCFRFMDWMKTNNSPVVNFSDYPSADWQRWERVPLSALVNLCAKKSADGWFCVPHQASDAFVNGMATYLRDNFPAGKKIRIELSNEIWNTGFTHAAYFKAQAESNWSLADGYADGAWLAYAGKRFAQVMAIFNDVFSGQTSRLIGVIAGQAANTGATERMADALLWATKEPANYVKPATLAKEISIAPYINWTGSATTQGDTIKSALDVSHDAAVQAVKDMIPASVAQSKTWITNHVSVAADRSCRLTMYEFSNHYDLFATRSSALWSGGEPVAGALDAFAEATYSEDMADAHDEVRAYFKAQNGSLQALFVELVRYTQYGTWGAATHINHDSAIWNALKAWHTANPRWWSQ